MRGKNDEESSSAKHDEIQIWAYENMKQILVSISKNPEIKENDISIINIELERPILNDKKYIIGYADIYVHFRYLNNNSILLLIEVKSKINSFGNLLRQINTYKMNIQNQLLLVISPDDKYKDILLDQGIRFYKYDF